MKSVLFVDDQKEILDLLKVKLKDKHYRTFFADSSDAALAVLKEEEIHVVVTDLLMPGKNGIALLQEIKELYPSVVRIVLSGLSQVSSILSAINSGDIYRYLTKPWKIDEQAESVIESALEYSEFLKSREECDELFSVRDIEAVLKAAGCSGSLRDELGNRLFGPDVKNRGDLLTLSNGCELRILPPQP